MPTKPTSVRKGAALVKKWAPRFGLSHYKSYVSRLSDGAQEDRIAESFYDHHEEWMRVDLTPDAMVPGGDAGREFLVLHELAHGLIDYANTSEEALETACNRIARLALGELNADGPRFHYCHKEWADKAEEANRMTPVRLGRL